jgi:hypothetical protein
MSEHFLGSNKAFEILANLGLEHLPASLSSPPSLSSLSPLLSSSPSMPQSSFVVIIVNFDIFANQQWQKGRRTDFLLLM